MSEKGEDEREEGKEREEVCQTKTFAYKFGQNGFDGKESGKQKKAQEQEFGQDSVANQEKAAFLVFLDIRFEVWVESIHRVTDQVRNGPGGVLLFWIQRARYFLCFFPF